MVLVQTYRTVRYIYTTNFDDFKAAQRLLQKQCPPIRKSFLFWYRFMPWIGAAALILLLRDMLFEHFSYPAGAAAVLGACAAMGIIPILSHPAHVRRLYRAMKNGRLDDEPLELEIADGALISRVPAVSEGRFQRASIKDRYEDSKVLVLFVTTKSFLLLPHRTLPDSAFADIRAWLSGMAGSEPSQTTS